MYCPVVGERVWVSGCRDAFVVAGTDYSAYVATIALSADMRVLWERVPFGRLFQNASAEHEPRMESPEMRETLRSSALCARQSRVAIREMRYTVQTTFDSIRRSQAMMRASDDLVARWRGLELDGAAGGDAETTKG